MSLSWKLLISIVSLWFCSSIKEASTRGLVASVYKGVPQNEKGKSFMDSNLSSFWTYLTIALAVLSPIIVFVLFIGCVFMMDWCCGIYGYGAGVVVNAGKAIYHWVVNIFTFKSSSVNKAIHIPEPISILNSPNSA